MINKVTYPSKIMLAGEYAVVMGGSAVTIPFNRYQATVRHRDDMPEEMSGEAEQSRKYLSQLYQYIAKLPREAFHAPPDLDLFSGNLKNYWLEMNIPTGYGLGSSGAVSAAVYDLFFPGAGEATLIQQKEDLAAIESFFHGKSSGVDALTCHSGSALYFKLDGSIEKVNLKPGLIPGGYRFFLLDSGERFDTGPLVHHFLEMMKTQGFASSIRNEYMILNQKLIESLLGLREADAGLLVRAISDYQFTHFRKMIPEKAIDFWIDGQVSNEYYLKLNGSGGGFMLGITHENLMESLNERWKEKVIWVE
jgi:mevalonate kinase